MDKEQKDESMTEDVVDGLNQGGGEGEAEAVNESTVDEKTSGDTQRGSVKKTGSDSLRTLERDVLTKERERAPRDQQQSVPGAHAVLGSESLDALERDVRAKERAQAAGGKQLSVPGAHAVRGSESLDALERDVRAKERAQSAGDKQQSVPGAHAVSAPNSLGGLENDVLAKVRREVGSTSVGSEARESRGSNSLTALESDILAKDRARASSGQDAIPGARAVSGSDSLGTLENDVLAKARASTASESQVLPASGSLTALERDLMAKDRARAARVQQDGTVMSASTQASDMLGGLEQDVLAKTRGRGVSRSPSEAVPGARSISGEEALNDLERDVLTKTRERDSRPSEDSLSATASLVQLENDALAKSRAREGPSNNAEVLDRLEDDVVRKLGGRPQRTDHDTSGSYRDNPNSREIPHGGELGSDEDRMVRTYDDQDGIPDDESLGYEEQDGLLSNGGRPEDDFHDSFASRPDNEAMVSTGVDEAATTVFEAEAVTTATSAFVVSEEEEKELERRKMRRYILGASGVIIIVIIVIVVVVVITGSGDDGLTQVPSATPSMMPSPAPSFAPTSAALSVFLEVLRGVYDDQVYFEKVFTDLNSPQYKAAQWLTGDDTFPKESFGDPKVLQRFALATFYFATNGDSWHICNRFDPVCTQDSSETSWLLDQDECDWNSVTCNIESSMVERIEFSTRISTPFRNPYELSGTLPSELAFLTGLQVFDILRNLVTGSIPASWSELSNLRLFRISENQVSGTLPPDFFKEKNSLQRLLLGDNQLTGTVPNEIATPQTLMIQLQNNSFHGTIPSEIGQATKLSE